MAKEKLGATKPDDDAPDPQSRDADQETSEQRRRELGELQFAELPDAVVVEIADAIQPILERHSAGQDEDTSEAEAAPMREPIAVGTLSGPGIATERGLYVIKAGSGKGIDRTPVERLDLFKQLMHKMGLDYTLYETQDPAGTFREFPYYVCVLKDQPLFVAFSRSPGEITVVVNFEDQDWKEVYGKLKRVYKTMEKTGKVAIISWHKKEGRWKEEVGSAVERRGGMPERSVPSKWKNTPEIVEETGGNTYMFQRVIGKLMQIESFQDDFDYYEVGRGASSTVLYFSLRVQTILRNFLQNIHRKREHRESENWRSISEVHDHFGGRRGQAWIRTRIELLRDDPRYTMGIRYRPLPDSGQEVLHINENVFEMIKVFDSYIPEKDALEGNDDLPGLNRSQPWFTERMKKLKEDTVLGPLIYDKKRIGIHPFVYIALSELRDQEDHKTRSGFKKKKPAATEIGKSIPWMTARREKIAQRDNLWAARNSDEDVSPPIFDELKRLSQYISINKAARNLKRGAPWLREKFTELSDDPGLGSIVQAVDEEGVSPELYTKLEELDARERQYRSVTQAATDLHRRPSWVTERFTELSDDPEFNPMVEEVESKGISTELYAKLEALNDELPHRKLRGS